MALLSAAETDAAQRHAVIDRAVVAYDSRFPQHHPHTMVNENATADTCSRMNFNAGTKTPHVADPAGKTVPALNPTPVSGAMKCQRMQAGITENHLHRTKRCPGLAREWSACLP